MAELLLQALYSGLLQGGAYALIALGLALVFGTMKIINLAHGELVLMAAYLAYAAESALEWHPLAAIALALPATCLAGAGMHWTISRIRADREINSLLLTFGIGVVLANGFLMVWSADVHSTASRWLQDALVFGPLYSMRSEALSFAISMVLLAGLWWWLARSWHGRALRAVAANREAAMLMGIAPGRTELLSFALAGALAAFAGVALYSYGVIQPALGGALTVKAFIITVLAGMGSIPGVLAAAILLGICEALTVTLASSALQELTGMLLFLLVLFLLPNGLFGAARRRG